jgi:hypothetical protein
MSALRKLKAVVLGHNLDMDKTRTDLAAVGVPVSDANCRACANTCSEGVICPRYTLEH